jgi:hypothetical protein
MSLAGVLHDSFEIASSQGRHCCVVTQTFSDTLTDFRLRFPFQRIPLHLVKLFCSLLLDPLETFAPEDVIYAALRAEKVVLDSPTSNADIEAQLRQSALDSTDPLACQPLAPSIRLDETDRRTMERYNVSLHDYSLGEPSRDSLDACS